MSEYIGPMPNKGSGKSPCLFLIATSHFSYDGIVSKNKMFNFLLTVSCKLEITKKKIESVNRFQFLYVYSLWINNLNARQCLSFGLSLAALYAITREKSCYWLATIVDRVESNQIKDSSQLLTTCNSRLQGLAVTYIYIFPTPPIRARCDAMSNFKRSTTGLNSEFSFSSTGCLTKAK